MNNRILVGDVREQLATLPDESVHCVVTSPPYWGLRDYGTATWLGGDEDCDHKAPPGGGVGPASAVQVQVKPLDLDSGFYRNNCGKCGATRIDAQLGLEPTPELFVQNMVAVFREVRRVLRSDGTLWLNLGDSYAGGKTGQDSFGDPSSGLNNGRGGVGNKTGERMVTAVRKPPVGLKAKDLVGIPWRVAFALQADGWWLRSDIIWSKPNPMPESVTDRPTKSHEYLFLLSKSKTYYYDAEAIREPLSQSSIDRINQPNFVNQTGGPKDYGPDSNRSMRKTLENFAERVMTTSHAAETASMYDEGSTAGRLAKLRQSARAEGGEYGNPSGRNRRTVWEIPTQPYAEAHFATYPEALVLPCIQAGTSEHGCCSECGAPWRRVVEKEYLSPIVLTGTEEGRLTDGRGLNVTRMGDGVDTRTTGWEPLCKHEAPLARAVVLDPFMGSGTTGLVAKRAGRGYIGIELNETYAAMAARRIGTQEVLL